VTHQARMSKGAPVCGQCACPRPKAAARSSAWRAITPVLLAALMPKCPMCLLGLLAAVGATGLERALGLDPRVLLGISVGMLAFVVVWFAVRRGVIGAVAVALASVGILFGKHVFSSTALVVCGLAILATYVLPESLVSRAGCVPRSATRRVDADPGPAAWRPGTNPVAGTAPMPPGDRRNSGRNEYFAITTGRCADGGGAAV
jgi:hypothetical protein